MINGTIDGKGQKQMAELYRSDIVNVDINKSLNRMYVGGVLATGDNKANRYGANVYRGGDPVSLDACGVTGYFIRPNMETVVIKGVAEGHTAYVDLEQACYACEGQFSLAIKVSSGGVVHTVRIVDGYIRQTQTDVMIDPGTAVPSLDDLFAQIAEMKAVTAEANAAAAAANEARKGIQDDLAALTEDIADSANAIVGTAVGDGIVVNKTELKFEAQENKETQEAPQSLINPFKNIVKHNFTANIFTDLKITENDDKININGELNVDKISFKSQGVILPESHLKLNFRNDKIDINSNLFTAKNEKTDINGNVKLGKKTNINLNVKNQSVNINNIKSIILIILDVLNIENDINEFTTQGYITADFNIDYRI